MAKTKEYVKLWFSYDAYFERYSDAEVGSLVRAMIAYRKTGKEPDFPGNERFIWPAIKRDIDESIAAQERATEASRENGKRGGRPRKTAAEEEPQIEEVKKTKPNETKKTDDAQKAEAKSQKENPGFDTFWKAYPKKVGKAAARKSFERVAVPLEKLIDAVNAQKQSQQWVKDGGQYIPNPATWLNQGRWEDELTPQKKEADTYEYRYRGIEDSL